MRIRELAKEGGTVAGIAREELEKRSGEKVVSKRIILMNLKLKENLIVRRSQTRESKHLML